MSDYEFTDDAAGADETPEQAEAPQTDDGWAPPSQAEYDAAIQNARAEAYYEALEAAPAEAEYAPEPEYAEQQQPYDAPAAEQGWLAEDPELAQYIDQRVQQGIEQGIQESLGAYEPILGMVAEKEGAALAEGYLGKIEENIGEFSHDHAHAIATGLVEAGASPGEALYRAALMQREHEQQLIHQAYYTYEQQLRNVSSASAQPGVAGAAQEAGELGDYDQIVADYVARQGQPSHAAG